MRPRNQCYAGRRRAEHRRHVQVLEAHFKPTHAVWEAEWKREQTAKEASRFGVSPEVEPANTDTPTPPPGTAEMASRRAHGLHPSRWLQRHEQPGPYQPLQRATVTHRPPIKARPEGAGNSKAKGCVMIGLVVLGPIVGIALVVRSLLN
jgi:hypothetical protein